MQYDDAPHTLALVADLIFASRIRGVAAQVGAEVITVGTPEALLQMHGSGDQGSSWWTSIRGWGMPPL